MKYSITMLWERRSDQPFTDNKYSRAHICKFDGGVQLPMSSSPQVVPIPSSDERAVDPEEAFVASVSSCHMLFFLSFAAANNFVIEKYEDNAEGIMRKNEDGKMVMTTINLKPEIIFSGKAPSQNEIKNFHEMAHDQCYIANSIKTEIKIIQA